MRNTRKQRVRTKIKARSDRPRLSIFVSNKHIFAQIIDDIKAITLVSVNDKEVGGGKSMEIAKKVGEQIAKKATEKGIKGVVFDRGDYKYHGKVKILADAAREGGLSL